MDRYKVQVSRGASTYWQHFLHPRPIWSSRALMFLFSQCNDGLAHWPVGIFGRKQQALGPQKVKIFWLMRKPKIHSGRVRALKIAASMVALYTCQQMQIFYLFFAKLIGQKGGQLL